MSPGHDGRPQSLTRAIFRPPTSEPSVERLPVVAVIAQATETLGESWRQLLRETAAPSLGYMVVDLFFRRREAPGEPSFLLDVLPPFLMIACLVKIGVSASRVAILGGASPRRAWGLLSWTFLETRFLGWFIATSALCSLAAVIMTAVMAVAPSEVLLGGLVIAVFYLWVRLCLVVPASAVERPLTLIESWGLTRGHAARLVLLIGAAELMPIAVAGMIRPAAGWMGWGDVFVRGRLPYELLMSILELVWWFAPVFAVATAYSWLMNVTRFEWTAGQGYRT